MTLRIESSFLSHIKGIPVFKVGLFPVIRLGNEYRESNAIGFSKFSIVR